MTLRIEILALTLLLTGGGCSSAGIHPEIPAEEMKARYRAESDAQADLWRGWDYVVEKLGAAGVADQDLRVIFLDQRFPPHTPVPFKLKPVESSQMYSQLTSETRVARAYQYLKEHTPDIERAERLYKVNRYVITAILSVETGCGQNTGRSLIIERLARVSSVGSPENLAFNFENVRREDPAVTIEQVKFRARYLEETFFPELLALFEMRKKLGTDVLELRGSLAGAFGIPQFLPSSYLKYAVDGDHDGVVSLFSHADAAASTANFLRAQGWNNNGSIAEKKKVLWAYNRSDAYAEAVIKVAIQLREKDRPVKSH